MVEADGRFLALSPLISPLFHFTALPQSWHGTGGVESDTLVSSSLILDGLLQMCAEQVKHILMCL